RSGTCSNCAGRGLPAKNSRSNDCAHRRWGSPAMTRIMAYADPWSVAPGEKVRFMVSCIGGDSYTGQSVQVEQPVAGPPAQRFSPELVEAPFILFHSGRLQSILIGSLCVVPANAALAMAGSFTLLSYVFPTTPKKGRQAIVGTWCEQEEMGYGLEIGHDGALTLRIGAGPGRITTISSGVPMHRRWYLAAAAFAAERRTATLWQEPLSWDDFHTARPVCVKASAQGLAAVTAPLTFAAWRDGPVRGPAAWGGLAFVCHFNGRIDAPRLARSALDRAALGALAGTPLAIGDPLVGAW